MQVYVEFALLENFCMDFTLLYAAKLAVKNAATIKRIAVASILGACFAVIFPLINPPAVLSVAIKIISGLVICLLGGKFKSVKGYIKFSGAFLALTAVVGGAIIAIFWLSGVNYSYGEGYILSSVPVGIPLFFALSALIGVRRIAKKFSKGDKKEVSCKIYASGNCVQLTALFDSGNRVTYRGSPVSVIDISAAKKLTDISGITEYVKVHTVTGSQKLKIFTAEKIEIDSGGKIQIFKGAVVGISARKIDVALLHPDLLEN